MLLVWNRTGEATLTHKKQYPGPHRPLKVPEAAEVGNRLTTGECVSWGVLLVTQWLPNEALVYTLSCKPFAAGPRGRQLLDHGRAAQAPGAAWCAAFVPSATCPPPKLPYGTTLWAAAAAAAAAAAGSGRGWSAVRAAWWLWGLHGFCNQGAWTSSSSGLIKNLQVLDAGSCLIRNRSGRRAQEGEAKPHEYWQGKREENSMQAAETTSLSMLINKGTGTITPALLGAASTP
eukprot:1159399-Pelagomonas_calceolata.AAC.6